MLAVALAAAVGCGAVVKGAGPETDDALQMRFAEVVARAEPTVSLTLCRMPDKRNPTAGSKMDVGLKRAFVFISARGRKMSADAQRALFAHELAHLEIQRTEPEPPFWHVMSFSEYLDRETRADALGARWVGHEAFVAAFREAIGGSYPTGPWVIREMTYRDLKLKGW